MQKILKIFLVSVLNVVSVGLGFAISGRFYRALFLAAIPVVLILFGAATGLLAYFSVFCIIGACVLAVYLYALFSPWFMAVSPITLTGLLLHGPLFLIIALTMEMAAAHAIKTYFFDTVAMTYNRHNLTKGDVVMVSKTPRNTAFTFVKNRLNGNIATQESVYPTPTEIYDIFGYPAYIFYSKDYSRIGMSLLAK